METDDLYTKNSNALYLHPNTSRILKEIRLDSSLSHISLNEIKKFQQALTEESKYKEFKILRGKKRYLSHRQWISFSPGNLTITNTCVQIDQKLIHTYTNRGHSYPLYFLLSPYTRKHPSS